jgi:hypothetical protein
LIQPTPGERVKRDTDSLATSIRTLPNKTQGNKPAILEAKPWTT